MPAYFSKLFFFSVLLMLHRALVSRLAFQSLSCTFLNMSVMLVSKDYVSPTAVDSCERFPRRQTEAQPQYSTHFLQQQELLRQISHNETLRLSAKDLVACAALKTVCVDKVNAQISYIQGTSEEHAVGLDSSSHSPGVRSQTLSARTIHKERKALAYPFHSTKNNMSQITTLPVIWHSRVGQEQPNNGTQVFQNYPQNSTCWLQMLSKRFKSRVGIVRLKLRSPCVPGNSVIIFGAKFRYSDRIRTSESVTWTGCEGPQDPLGDFLGRSIFVGFHISRFDVQYNVTVEYYSYLNKNVPPTGLQLEAFNITETFGESCRADIFCLKTVRRWQLTTNLYTNVNLVGLTDNGLQSTRKEIIMSDKQTTTRVVQTRKASNVIKN